VSRLCVVLVLVLAAACDTPPAPLGAEPVDVDTRDINHDGIFDVPSVLKAC
jgi:hypothetical protein